MIAEPGDVVIVYSNIYFICREHQGPIIGVVQKRNEYHTIEYISVKVYENDAPLSFLHAEVYENLGAL